MLLEGGREGEGERKGGDGGREEEREGRERRERKEGEKDGEVL